ncbi:MAG: hypothetical protein K0S09_1657 [Sphingobacteriaceae bacterium]|jgi:PAS domain S-box-containing protein|nr:hypothetical protein [Sphingobacteriaceae bacterium]
MKPVNILLVDDDEDDFIITRDLLNESDNRQNYNLTWCNNYEEAINAMLKSFYDVYLVDYNLGKYTGIDLLREAIRSNCTEPLIMLTAQGDFKIDEEAMKIGAADYLVKNKITSQVLERSIRYSLAHSQALRNLKESEYKFRMIFERSKDPMIVSDIHGNHYDANPAALNFFEMSREDFLKAKSTDFYPSKEERKKFVNSMEEKGSVTDLELQLALPNGKTKYCSVSSFLQVSQHATTELYYSNIHDLTHRRQQEQESVLTEKLAVSERIAKSLADEIQNPLSNVHFALEEMTDALNGSIEPVQMYIDIIKENCIKIDQLTTDFIASTEPKSLVFERVEVDSFLAEIISEAQLLLQVRAEYSSPAQHLYINADIEKLKEAVMNLFKNASEALPDNDRNVSVTVEHTSAKVYIQVKDKGCGIEEENLDKIFEPFYTTKLRSSGLGLTYTQRIIEAHNGSVIIESRRNVGTSATLSLPLADHLN